MKKFNTLVCAITATIVCGFFILLHHIRDPKKIENNKTWEQKYGNLTNPLTSTKDKTNINDSIAKKDEDIIQKINILIEKNENSAAISVWQLYATSSFYNALLLISKLPDDFSAAILQNLGSFLDSMTESKPSEASSWISNFKVRNVSDSALRRRIFIKLLTVSPEIAIESMNKFEGDEKIAMLRLTLASLARFDPDKALLFAESHDHKDSVNILSGIIISIARSDPALAYELVQKHNLSTNDSVFQSIFTSWLAADAASAISKIKKMPTSALQSILSSTENIKNIISHDPQELRSLMLHIPLSGSTEQTLKNVYKYLGSNNFSLAVTILADLPESKFKGELTTHLFNRIAEYHPEQIDEILREMPSESLSHAILGASQRLAVTNLDKALEISNMLNIQDRKLSMKNIGNVLASIQPQRALRLLDNPNYKAYIDDETKSIILQKSVAVTAHRDIEAAKKITNELTDSDKPQAMTGLVASWMKTDPIAASEWLSKQPPGPARDAGAREIIKQIKDTDPAMAKQWQDSITPTPK